MMLSKQINDSDKTDSPQKIKPWVDDGSSPDGVLPHFLHFLASFLTSEDRKLVEPAELSEALRNLSRLAFSGLIFSTRAEWDAMKRGLNNDVPPEFWSVFHENTSYLSGSWQVPAPDVWLDASTSGAQGAEFSRTQVEESLFPSLTKLLDDIGGQKSTPKKRILLVPAEIKNLILTLIKQRWSLVNGVVRPWSYRNERLKLYELPSVLRVEQNKDYLAQDRALDNLTILGLLPDEIRPVLVGDLATALKYNRPNYVQQSGRTVLLLSDTACQGDPSQHLLGSRVTTAKTPASSPVQNTVPHLLWLLASESKFLPPEKMLQLTNGSMPARQDMLMVGTPEEWQAIQHQLETFEYRFPGFRDLFSVESLAQPSIGDRLDILLNLFSDSYLKTLGINFENTDNADKTKRSLLTYFITRCDRLAKDTKKDEIAQFLYAVDELGKALIQDPTLRGKSGAVLDKRFFDRFFSRIFNIPIDVNSLPDDDWFRKLSDSRTMLVALGSPPVQDEKTGRNESVPAHTGSTRIKNELLRIFTANLRAAHDDGHTIPNSFIFLGKQGSGKTHFIKKLIEIGKLKLYDFSRPTDESAQVFYINCRNLSAASEKSTAGVVEKIKISASEIGLTADEIILHLKNFLSLPYGYRGAIYFDDLSAAPTDALQKILTFIQSLFDAPGGMFGIMDSSGEKREIPLKNLTLGVIINPTEDEEQLRKFGVYSTYPPQDTKVIIATLSRGERPIDASFISRFSAVKNFSELDASAKGPALLERVAGKNKSTFGQDGKIMFVSLNAANQIVTLAGDVGAREFFAPALSGMQALSCSQEDKITIIVSRNELGMPESGAGTSVPQAVAYGSFRSASGTSGTEIETKIVEQFISIPINLNQYEGRLLLLKIMMNSFRINLLKFFVETLLDDARYTETPLFASDQVPYILQAVLDHVDIVSEFPINAMKLDPDQFGARTDVAREKFQTVLSNLSKNEVPMNRVFPVQYGQANDTGKFSLFGVASTSDSPGRDRSQILAGVVRNVRSLLGPLLGSFFRVSHEGSSNIDTWKTNLSKADPEKEFKTAGNALLTTYGGLYLGLVQADLRETILHDRYESITAYDQAKLFLIALDQAISLLPWGEMLQFMMQVLSSVKGDYGAYQHPGMLHFLFEGKLTPMHLATTDILKLIIESNPIYGEYKRGNPAPLKEPWFNKCEKLLASGGGRST
ncbi:MAG: hypothetical protein HY072_06535 [Deltaproteobacteria bacterium]|nr:hypothetical protein [Deltaproteobacteria bacterium]